LFLIFSGIEVAPGYGYNGTYPKAGPVKTYAFPPAGTTWVACMNAVLNITFLWGMYYRLSSLTYRTNLLTSKSSPDTFSHVYRRNGKTTGLP
jgi:hypothetical protein